jgi:hypothetical protein
MLIWPSRLVLDFVDWVWPPALFGLVVWMIIGCASMTVLVEGGVSPRRVRWTGLRRPPTCTRC